MAEFRNNHITIGRISGARVAVSVPSEGMENNIFKIGTIDSSGLAFEVRDPPSLAQRLGLPTDTPPQVVEELLKLTLSADSPAHLATRVQTSGAWQRVGQAADLMTVVTALYTFKNVAAEALKRFFGG